MALVTGRVIFDGGLPNVIDGVLTVKLEDVSLVGMKSELVGTYSCELNNSNIDGLDFEIHPNANSPDINPRSNYVVTAHFSTHPDDDSDGIRQGDYLTMQSYPVLTHGNPSAATVELKRIG